MNSSSGFDSRSVTLAEKELDGDVKLSTRSSLDEKRQPEKDETSFDLEKDEAGSSKNDLPTHEDEEEFPSGFRLILLIIALILSVFLVSLDMTIIATAIPKITDEFHGIDQIAWYGSAFFLTVASFQSTWGKGYKYFPLKITFLIAIFIFELGSLICGVAPNSTALIVGRAIAGIGGAGIASGAYTIIAVISKPSQRAAYTGLLGASYGVASVIGPLLGGVFASEVTWRWCFYINLPIGGLAAAVVVFFFQTPARAKPVSATFKEKILQMDLPGTFIVMAGTVCFLLALQWAGGAKPWSSADVIGTLVGFVLIFALFVVVEYFQGERAMIVGRLLKDRTMAVSMAFIFFLGGGFFLLLYYIPIYFQVVSGVSASQSGIRNLPLILGVTISTIASGGLISAFGHYVPFLIAGSSMATIGAGLLYTLDQNSTSAQWIGYQALAGLGVGLCLQVPIICAQALAAPSDLSSATAMVLFSQTIGGAFFVSAGQSALTNVLLSSLPTTAPSVIPAAVAATGATELRDVFSAEVIPGIIEAYMDGLKISYVVAIVALGLAVVISFGSKWQSLKGKIVPGGAA